MDDAVADPGSVAQVLARVHDNLPAAQFRCVPPQRVPRILPAYTGFQIEREFVPRADHRAVLDGAGAKWPAAVWASRPEGVRTSVFDSVDGFDGSWLSSRWT